MLGERKPRIPNRPSDTCFLTAFPKQPLPLPSRVMLPRNQSIEWLCQRHCSLRAWDEAKYFYKTVGQSSHVLTYSAPAGGRKRSHAIVKLTSTGFLFPFKGSPLICLLSVHFPPFFSFTSCLHSVPPFCALPNYFPSCFLWSTFTNILSTICIYLNIFMCAQKTHIYRCCLR